MTIPYITLKQQEIPKLLYKFRFLNRLQIQQLLKHKYHKRIIDWLNDLIEKDYIEKLSKENAFEERTKLTIYRIGINGIRFLRTLDDYEEEIIRKLYKDKDRSDNFIDWCILLADICINLQNKTIDKDSVTYEAEILSDFINPDSPYHFLIDLNPSLVYKEEKHKKGAKNNYYLLEIFEQTLPRYSVRKKIKNYLEFYSSNEWEDNMQKPFPILKYICPTKPDLIYAKRITKKELEENQNPSDLKIQFATIDEVKEFGVIEVNWEEVE